MAGPTRRSFGRIEKRDSRRYRAAYTGPDGLLYRAPSTFDSKIDAEGWLAQRRQEIQLETWAPGVVEQARKARDAVTFGDFAEVWLAARRTKRGPLKPRTKAHYRNLLDRFLLPAFQDVPINKITPEDVQAWYDAIAASTPTYRSHAYSLLRTILQSAMSPQHRLIAFNPCHIRGAGTVEKAHETKLATLDELEKIVTALPDRYKLMCLFAAWCALRFGELTELRREDLVITTDKRGKPVSGVIRVRRGVVKVGDEFIVGDPKSNAGRRDVAIPPHLLPSIVEHLKQHMLPGKDALLFPAASGGHMAPSSLYKVYYPAREAAGRSDLRWHDLRHLGAVLAAQTGATLAELMSRLGHSTPSAALRYQHAGAERDSEIARRLSAMAK